MKIKFNEPVTVGGMAQAHRRAIAEMEVVTLSFNLRPASGKDNMIVSITLQDVDSDHKEHFLYEDSEATPEFWNGVCALELDGKQWIAHLCERLIADGKLPPGTID